MTCEEKCDSDTGSEAGSTDSIKLVEEQQEYYELMIEHIVLEMKVFEDARRNSEEKEIHWRENSVVERKDDSVREKKELKEMEI